MPAAGEPLSGQCLCGAVAFTARPLKPEMDVCHCGMCRRWSGGVFMAVPCTDVSVADDAALGVYASSEWGERVFCRTCGASLFWRMRDGSGHVAVSMPAFENSELFVFAEEIFIDDKPSTYEFAGERRRLTGAETQDQFVGSQEKAE
ncbi:GFA family protein [Antarcticirhabdus aurantiaca]|uniref:GFA family protein n=1 Tax=Antarcticirhabdus aurantiaca TaxID=2606717 RepID=A0ACD4NVV1_9HYPH|nr:GFA family protein [Antarcticirhabdus aurantiaca]WAJ31090.1 GFA family protein [Jeongeuplla avenae]